MILAGEYPGAAQVPAAETKVRKLLDAGVRTFVDLTHPGELSPYDGILSSPGIVTLSEAQGPELDLRYVRLPVRDLNVPDPETMHKILDMLDAELAAGRTVYVHCWGGVGRTGTVVGCHLVRRGRTGEEALAELASLWQSVEKRDRHPRSPETDRQREFVRRWDREETSRRTDRYRGCLLGGAVGDALGAPVEFLSLERIRERYGSSGIRDFDTAYGRVGAITDDTQMTLFTAEGILRAVCRARHRGICHPPSVIHHAYLRWLHTQGRPYDAVGGELDGWLIRVPALHSRRAPGTTCLSALSSGHVGSLEERINDSKGCGGVMRAAPAGLLHDGDAFRLGAELAALTHGHPSGYLAAGALAVMVDELVRGRGLATAVQAARDRLAAYPEHGECAAALERAVTAAASGVASAEVVESLGEGWVAEEALAIGVYCALAARGDFAAGVRLAVNHSGDSDSTGAIAGNLLGAAYGARAIPATWLDRLELRPEIEAIADDLLTRFTDTDEWWTRYPGW